MNDLTEKVAAVLRPYKNKKFAIGVSGGRDSMCLLFAVMTCGAVEKSNILAVHVNHCLRDEADSDEEFVRMFCAKNGIEFRAYKVNVKQNSENNGLTIEQAARNLRYGVFYDILKCRDADIILTAHHALDNAETVLMHMFRGAGLDGLRGMKNDTATANEAVPLHMFRGSGLDGLRGINNGMATANDAVPLRPFIDVYPSELDEYCKEHGIEYVTDKTNFVDDADRNFIRLNVIPLIEQRYRGAVRAINALSEECRAACVQLEAMLDMSNIRLERGAVIISNVALGTPLAARYVRRALEYFSTVDITREQIERVTSLAHMRTGAVVELTGGLCAANEYGAVVLYIPRPVCDTEKPVVMGANTIDGLAVDIEKSAEPPHSIRGGAVDLDKLCGATVRFRRDGDMFTPYGGGHKKLKQYFIDNKIPKRLRDRIPLICKGSEVLVVVGMQISESVKQTEDTQEKGIVRLRW